MYKWFMACLIGLGLSLPVVAAEPLKWAGCGISKKAFMAELAKAYEKKTGTKIVLEGGGATKGIRRVASKEVHIGGSCRPKLKGHRDELTTQMNPVAWDALVVIVNQSNSMDNITLEQVRDIYEGKITSWKTLNGQNKPIKLLVRSGKHSGVGRTLRELVWADFDKNFHSSHVFKSSGPLEKAVVADPYAIAITGISSAQKRDVKIVKLNGKAPDYANIRSGDYLLYRPLYITFNPNNPRADEVRKFIDYAHTRQAREIIRKQGVVPYLDAIHLTHKQREQWQKAHAMRVTQN